MIAGAKLELHGKKRRQNMKKEGDGERIGQAAEGEGEAKKKKKV